jgi:hypothetical protein
VYKTVYFKAPCFLVPYWAFWEVTNYHAKNTRIIWSKKYSEEKLYITRQNMKTKMLQKECSKFPFLQIKSKHVGGKIHPNDDFVAVWYSMHNHE